MAATAHIGSAAIAAHGWWHAYRFLILRRAAQIGILALFLMGPWFGIWVVKGNLSSSLTLGELPLTDPYLLLQSLVARHWPETTAIAGALIVAFFYFVVGGRVYCAWVCPMNIVTDTAHWLRRRLGIGYGARLRRSTRYWMLAATLVVAAVTGTLAWELVNPPSMLHRGILFGMGLGWTVIAAVFLFDLFIARHGWCGHLCPMGAFYSVIGLKSPLRVVARRREQCDDCMDCVAVCPEPQILPPVLHGGRKNTGPVIESAVCSNCGRCIDVCSRDVFEFGTRLGNY